MSSSRFSAAFLGPRRRLASTAAAVAALTLIAAGAQVAYAHALLERAEPGPGAVIAAENRPSQISLWFSEPVSVSFSSISVLDADSRRVDALDAHVSASDPTRVDARVGGLGQGAYVVRWQAISADNHVVRGSYWFAVGFATAPPTGALVTNDAPSAPPLEVVGRALVLAAILALAGATFFRILVTRPLEARLGIATFEGGTVLRRQQVLWVTAGALLCSGQVLWAAAQAESIAGVSAPQALSAGVLQIVLFESSFGLLWWTRLTVGLALAVSLLAYGRVQLEQRRWMLWPQVVLGVLLVLSVSMGSHAAAARALPALAVTMDFLHLSAAALWLGGLLILGLVLPRLLRGPAGQRTVLLRQLVPRVSTFALASVGCLLATGTFSAWEEVASFEALLGTPYGQSLLVKLGLLAVLLATAAINLLVVRPRAAAERSVTSATLPRLFHRLVLTEVIIGGGVLVAVGVLSSLPPPGLASLPAPIESTRQAGDLRIRLRVDPNWIGISQFRVTLVDQQGGPPADVLNVVLTFSMQGMNMGRTTVFATPKGEGVYESTGFYVGMPGLSQVGVSVSRSSGQDQSVVFLVDVPDLSHKQFDGLRGSLGVGPVGLLGLALGVLACLAAVAWGSGSMRPGGVATAGFIAVLVGGGVFVADSSGAINAAATSQVAVPPGKADLTRAKSLFEHHCVACHGETGVGNGPAAASLLPPPSDLTLHARWHPDEQLYWFISNGVSGTAMPAWSDQLTPEERRDVIGYLHELANAPTATPLVAPSLPAVAAAPTLVSQRPPEAQPTQANVQSPPAATAAAPQVQVVSTAAPTPSLIAGLSGRLVFGPDTDGNLWVWTFPSDKPQKLTTFGPGEYSSNAVWSPDGRQIAFSYYKLPRTGAIPIPDGTDLYLAKADGSEPRLLAQHDVKGVALQFPAWAPDGKSLYVSYRDLGGTEARVDRVDVETGARTQVVTNAGFPAISRDGRKLAYATSPAGAQQRGTTLMWSGPNGEEPHLILGPQVFQKFYGLRISPDGQHLLFAAIGAGNNYVPPQGAFPSILGLLGKVIEPTLAYADGEAYDLWTIELSGQGLQRVTTLAEDLPIGAWSPDGQQIAFLGGGSATIAQSGLAVVNADGSQLRRITGVPGHRGLDWAITQ